MSRGIAVIGIPTVCCPWPGCAGNSSSFFYDALGRVTNFAYDPLGRVTQVTFPSSLTESYTYDAVGNLLSKKDRKGQTISYAYDALDRLVTKTFPDLTGVSYVYDALSRLTQAVDPSGTYAFGYDNLGRLVGTTTNYSFLPRTLTMAYSYDAASNRLSLTDPEGGVTGYAYDSLNRLTNLTDFTGSNFGFSYDPLGRRTNLSRPNGVSTSYQYDALSRLLAILHQGSAFSGGTSYAYDPVGNRTSRADTFLPAGGSLTQTVTSYSYDALYELTQAVLNGTTSETYTYDAVGNRLSSLGVPSYLYNNSNELTSIGKTTFSYDANGNTLSKATPSGTTSYAWDFENRLTSVSLPNGSVVHYKYDPFGRRVFSDATGRIFVYDGDNVLEDLDLTGKPVARYTQGLGVDEPLATTASGVSSSYEADGLGSITSLTTAAGTLANTYSYDSFGNVTASSGAVSNRFFFTAREASAKTGLLYYRARYYDPSVGRFLSEDPINVSAGIDFYTYAANNPALLLDPLGLDPRKKCDLQKPCDLSKVKAFPGDQLTKDPNVLLLFYCLWAKAGYGFRDTERAAWVVKANEAFNLSLIPFTNEPSKVTAKISVPSSAVAFAHTHPDPPKSRPEPSAADRVAASQLRMPLYTISRTAVYKALPQVEEAVSVAGQDWWKQLTKCKCD